MKPKRIKLRAGYPVSDDLIHLCLASHVPQKWVVIDMETGDVWQGQQDGGWKRPDTKAAERAADILFGLNAG